MKKMAKWKTTTSTAPWARRLAARVEEIIAVQKHELWRSKTLRPIVG